MNKYKKILEGILLNAYEFQETKTESGYYLRTKVTDPKAIAILRKLAAKVFRKARS